MPVVWCPATGKVLEKLIKSRPADYNHEKYDLKVGKYTIGKVVQTVKRAGLAVITIDKWYSS